MSAAFFDNDDEFPNDNNDERNSTHIVQRIIAVGNGYVRIVEIIKEKREKALLIV